MPEIIVIGGTAAPKEAYPLYAPILNSVHSSIPAQERYFPLPNKGLGPVMDTLEELRDRVCPLVRNLDEKPIVVGHSQGGVHAAMLGSYGLASVVVSLASPHGGMRSLGVIESLSPAAHDLDAHSDFIAVHRDELANYRSDVALHTVNATFDQIVLRQFSVTSSTRWWDAPRWVPGCLLRIPEGVRRLRSALPSEHILLPWSTGVRWLVSSLATGQEMGMAA